MLPALGYKPELRGRVSYPTTRRSGLHTPRPNPTTPTAGLESHPTNIIRIMDVGFLYPKMRRLGFHTRRHAGRVSIPRAQIQQHRRRDWNLIRQISSALWMSRFHTRHCHNPAQGEPASPALGWTLIPTNLNKHRPKCPSHPAPGEVS